MTGLEYVSGGSIHKLLQEYGEPELHPRFVQHANSPQINSQGGTLLDGSRDESSWDFSVDILERRLHRHRDGTRTASLECLFLLCTKLPAPRLLVARSAGFCKTVPTEDPPQIDQAQASSGSPALKVSYILPGLRANRCSSIMNNVAIYCTLGVLFVVARAADEASRILSVPGFDGNLASPQYSGYITVDENRGRALFYYFVTSERNLSSDPVILWLNGGPGCSSFDGFIYEHGPFKFHPGREPHDLPLLVKNPYTWTKIANFIYLESPAGVGFSYSNTSADYNTDDFKTARDAHTFLLKWFELYPEYLNHEFYICGQSYGGVYIPDLSMEIANGIDAGVTPVLNFKGYMIGNGWTDRYYDGNALVPFVYGMGLIPIDLFQEVDRACNGSYWNATAPECLSKMATVAEDISDLNIYNILEPCYHKPNAWEEGGIHSNIQLKIPSSFRKLGEANDGVPVRKRMFGLAWPLRMSLESGVVPSWNELDANHLKCVNTQFAHVWLNNPLVRSALHAMPEKLIGKWTVCSDILTFQHNSGSKVPTHRNLTKRGYRAHIYSGDHDLCVPYTGTEAWTRSLGYKEDRAWHPWYVDGQVAGYSVSYENHLTFTTVKGCGHTVPEYKPKEALAMLERWLNGSILL